MKYQLLYYGGKKKALTFSYDDGEIHDRRLVEIFNKYEMRATFHLNSGKLGQEGYVTAPEVKELYGRHEVACHGVEHKYLPHLTKEQLVNEVWRDRESLESLAETYVKGMSYPFGEYDGKVIDVLKSLGIEYSRTVESSGKFTVPGDFMQWHPTCHHKDGILEKGEQFLNMPEYRKLPLFYIWGHSYEFHREDNWEIMETFCEKMAFKDDIWYATNMEYRNYMMAAGNLLFRADESYVKNISAISVWIQAHDAVWELRPGMEMPLV